VRLRALGRLQRVFTPHSSHGIHPTGVAAAVARVRALLFYLVTLTLSLPLFVSMVLITPFQLAFDKQRRAALHFVNDVWATCSTSLFYRVEARLCTWDRSGVGQARC
jgi:hypothetical protein